MMVVGVVPGYIQAVLPARVTCMGMVLTAMDELRAVSAAVQKPGATPQV